MMSEAAAVIETAAAEEGTALESVEAQAVTEVTNESGAAQAANDNWLPEKHVVKKEDGTIDLEASARKQADAYRALEKRLGTGDIPPKTAEEYAPELKVEGFDLEELKQDEMYQDFAKKAHEAGMTNAQFSLAVNEFLPRVAELLQADSVQTAAACDEELAKVWTTPNEMTVNKQNALRTIKAFADSPDQERAIIKAVGNNAEALKLLAKIGPELQEGRAPQAAGLPAMIDIEALQKSEAYWNENHPEHSATKAKVARYYESKYPKK